MINRDLEAILQQAIGLKITSLSQSSIERVMKRRLAALGLESLDDYLGRLKSSPQELKTLIEEVVIPETWFFRDGESYTFLAGFLRQQLKPTGNRPLRILSIPCSTGEEPYSIAITALQAGWPPYLLRVDAVDISVRAIELARRGEYRPNSFRGDDL
ncbi:CheR family methyltransferase, partial [Desulfurivibrio sp. D14AmB]|uniref:CheR family methyltransferase n=1 Tax=Desulfurivibrio sp. D14AmB TaxID=3374370 RepID=UPI00376EAFE2